MKKRRLILLRHAEAASPPQGNFSTQADFSRPLTRNGEGAAHRCGLWLQHHNLAPDYILCSPAQRTRQTLEKLSVNTRLPDQKNFSSDLYNASWQMLLTHLRAVPGTFSTLLIIAHNPGISALAAFLSSHDSRLPLNFSPADLAVFSMWEDDLPAPDWSDCDPFSTNLDTFSRP